MPGKNKPKHKGKFPQKVSSTSWKKGQPGNPKGLWKKGGPCPNPHGRPKETAEVKELRQRIREEHGDEILEKLLYLMRNAGNEKTQLAAAIFLAEQAWGKPAQAITGPDGEKIPISFTLTLGDNNGSGNSAGG